MSRRGWGGGLLVVAALLRAAIAMGDVVVLDDFEDVTDWTAITSNGGHVEIGQDPGPTGMAMRIDFDLRDSSGYVIVRKALDLKLPANYAFTFQMRAVASPNTFEVKLVDPAQNVWWRQLRDFVFPTDWQRVMIKKPRFVYAWGPAGGGTPEHVSVIEIALAAGTGGKGSLWIDQLQLEERPAPSANDPKPTARASTTMPGSDPAFVLDRDPKTTWRSGSLAGDQWLLIDFEQLREYGGLVIDWDPQDFATAYEVQTSDDGEQWTTAYAIDTGNGRRDYIYMPDAESRYVRLALQRPSREQGYGIVAVSVQPFEFSASPNNFFEVIARDAAPGIYPKYFYGKQTYWTVIGVDGDDKEALINEEGMLEVDQGSFSIEPFLLIDGALITWNQVETTQELMDGYLPIPTVRWHIDSLELAVTAYASGPAGASTLNATYRVTNNADEGRHVALFLSVRPFQVLPPWQSLNMIGGVAPIHDLEFDRPTVWVNGNKAVTSLTLPDRFGASTMAQGPVVDFLVEGRLPAQSLVSDPVGYASGALRYDFDLAPRSSEEVYVAVPFHDAHVDEPLHGAPDVVRERVAAELDETARGWRALLGRVDIQLPPGAEKLTNSMKSALAHILINRDGAAIQPGSRTYARSWIRDGAMTSDALLQMGFTEEVRAFIRWFAKYQQPDGKVPCCVDKRGADPVPEHDSPGAFIYTIMQYYRFTRDVGFVNEVWPHVVKAADYIAALREQRLTAAYTSGAAQRFYGLLPESISHEGYSAHPVHSYWDDFFALRGVKDAADMAAVIGDDAHAVTYAALRDAFRTDLYASINRTIERYHLDYIPGSADLGDLDPSSTAIALVLGGEGRYLPEPALTHTFDRYYSDLQTRFGGTGSWQAYTPYELRNAAAFALLGQRERALEVMEIMLADQRPAAWNQWAEIIWRDPNVPKFIGDMPHSWISSTYLVAFRTLFAYEREEDRALVLAAGVPQEWLEEPGVSVRRLPTYYGVLSYRLRRDGPTTLHLTLSGDLSVPAGGIVLQPPLPQPLTAVTVNGAPADAFDAASVVIRAFPADVILEHAPEPTVAPLSLPGAPEPSPTASAPAPEAAAE